MKEETVTIPEVTLFERVRPQLQTLCDELRELAKKKADSVMSKLKTNLINEKLKDVNSLLGTEGRPFREFELFNADDLSTTSDAVIILSQYLEALETWRSARIFFEGERRHWYWNIDDEKMFVKTDRPKRAQLEQVEKDDDQEEE